MNDVPNDRQWHYSERAGKYYRVKWKGEHADVNMPQFNFSQRAWREECRRVIRFRRDAGIDGMVVDAVNWYTYGIWKR